MEKVQRPGNGAFLRPLQHVSATHEVGGVTPAVARGRVTVKLPRETRPELQPPPAEHVLAVHRLLPAR